ncbi:hypothetical protein GCM10027416_15550 [Okibacterium endophyticum]
MVPLSRITPATVDVLDVLLGGGTPMRGLLVVKQTGRPTGSVYPILERLEGAGWVTSEWENDPERTGPRRRLHELAQEGADAARAAVTAARSRWDAQAARSAAVPSRIVAGTAV